MDLPGWAAKYLSQRDCQQIISTIRDIEKKAHGEILVAISQRSTPLYWLPWVSSLLFGLFFLLILSHFFYEKSDYLLQVFIFIMGLVLGNIIARLPFYQKIWIHPLWKSHHVKQKSLFYFWSHGVSRTPSQSGILIYISLWEKRFEILVDRGLSSKVKQEIWTQAVLEGSQYFKKKQFSQGLLSILEACSHLLETHFHKNEEKENELHEELKFLEPEDLGIL